MKKAVDFDIQVNVLREAGYEEALYGLAKNRKQPLDKMQGLAERLANKDYGHNKYLRMIYVWLDVRAPRYWWQEMDTYQFQSQAYFECTKQSESTMNSLTKELFPFDALGEVKKEEITREWVENWCIDNLEKPRPVDVRHLMEVIFLSLVHFRFGTPGHLLYLKQRMPEFLMQSREICLNYQSLRNMLIQRKRHRLPHWGSFFEQVMEKIAHPELLGVKKGVKA